VILLSLVLVIVAAVALVLGLFQDGLVLIYVSMATTLAAMLVLAVASVLRRRQEAAAGSADHAPVAAPSNAAVARPPVSPLGRTGGAPEEQRDAGDQTDDRAFRRPAEQAHADSGATAEPVVQSDDAGTGSTAVDRPVRKRAVVKRPPAATPQAPAGSGRTEADLTTVRGLGPAKRERLLERFGSVDAIAAATVDDLTEVPGIGVGTARAIKDALR
jgi:predicted flap endonuclease-1-like 5' DNA nuclease